MSRKGTNPMPTAPKPPAPPGPPSVDDVETVLVALASKPKPAPVLLTDEEIDDVYIEGKRVWIGKLKIARAIESEVLRKNGWGG